MHTIVSVTSSVVHFAALAETAKSQVGQYSAALLGQSSTPWLICVVIVLIFVIVVWPAVWSRQAVRRKAAREVLDMLVRLV